MSLMDTWITESEMCHLVFMTGNAVVLGQFSDHDDFLNGPPCQQVLQLNDYWRGQWS